jgi:hypothetical protein
MTTAEWTMPISPKVQRKLDRAALKPLLKTADVSGLHICADCGCIASANGDAQNEVPKRCKGGLHRWVALRDTKKQTAKAQDELLKYLKTTEWVADAKTRQPAS